MVNYEEAMALALTLAKRGTGAVSPNPLVGAVILKNGEIIASGYHHKFGDVHAEIDAINNAGNIDFSDAVMVVNLEPCSHQGKQPPCADAIVKHGFKEVVIGMLDPNPLVAGKGIKILENGGISVKTGILENECKWLNRVFIKHITSGMPYISLKTAQSLNGAIATESGNSKWISGEESRRYVHQLRAEYDAVAIGKNTALLDNPELTVRMTEGRNPYRIVFDTNLAISGNLRLVSDNERQKTIIIASYELHNTNKAKQLQDKGVSIIFTGNAKDGRTDLRQALKELYENHKIASVLVEGGSSLLNSFLKHGLIDEYHLFIAPKIIANGLNAFRGDYSIETIEQALELELIDSTKSGRDLHLLYVKKQ
jgi:diaminohydroxyphosphoribosylaminopyrimidine deaminase/5-amino-6-(5-phosphoribosylamino)uracil reductase